MADDPAQQNLDNMSTLDFDGWDKADWDGVFSAYHTDDVFVQWQGQDDTHDLPAHIALSEQLAKENGGSPVQITGHPIAFGTGEWTCVVGQLETGSQMVTVAKWRDGKIAEEYIWM